MTRMTDENDNLVVVEEVTCSMPISQMNQIFILADKIAQIQVRYDDDPLIMANAAIKQMKEHAEKIAVLAHWHGN